MKPEKPTLDRFHYHELLDRTNTINIMIDQLLVDHPAVVVSKDTAAAVDSLISVAADLYQLVGRVCSELDDKETK